MHPASAYTTTSPGSAARRACRTDWGRVAGGVCGRGRASAAAAADGVRGRICAGRAGSVRRAAGDPQSERRRGESARGAALRTWGFHSQKPHPRTSGFPSGPVDGSPGPGTNPLLRTRKSGSRVAREKTWISSKSPEWWAWGWEWEGLGGEVLRREILSHGTSRGTKPRREGQRLNRADGAPGAG